jgi:hypothetical protein
MTTGAAETRATGRVIQDMHEHDSRICAVSVSGPEEALQAGDGVDSCLGGGAG